MRARLILNVDHEMQRTPDKQQLIVSGDKRAQYLKQAGFFYFKPERYNLFMRFQYLTETGLLKVGLQVTGYKVGLQGLYAFARPSYGADLEKFSRTAKTKTHARGVQAGPRLSFRARLVVSGARPAGQGWRGGLGRGGGGLTRKEIM
jgi:hypothetical protein